MSLLASFSSKRRQHSSRPSLMVKSLPLWFDGKQRYLIYLFMANNLRPHSYLASVIQVVSDSLHQQVLSSLNAWDGTDEDEQFRWVWREEKLGITMTDPWNGVHSSCLNGWQLVNNSNLKTSSPLGMHGLLHELMWLPGITMISSALWLRLFFFFFFK